MSVPWQWLDENPNPTGGCTCYPHNDPDQPDGGVWCNPRREFSDLGYQSPHVVICDGCTAPWAKDRHAPESEVVDSTAVEVEWREGISDPASVTDDPAQPVEPKATKRKAAPAAD